MAHFAKLDENNVVLAVHVVNNDVITINNVESEQIGIDFLTDLHGYSLWKQTSYNGTIRKNYAGIGYAYDSTRDAFIAPKLFNSWILDEATCQWQAPTPMPITEGKTYYWSEDDLSWRETTNE
jgi:hypothetical protein